ncbi:MAG: LuxR C-terminal-related transcriptional regulator [Myxococcaceae bacterium]
MITSLDPRDAEQVEALSRRIVALTEAGASDPDSWMHEFQAVLGLDHVVFYGVRLESARALSLSFFQGLQLPPKFSDEMNALLRESPRRWGVFNPAKPEPEQRNKAFWFPNADETEALFDRTSFLIRHGVKTEEEGKLAKQGFQKAAALFRRLGVADKNQLRTLICEGEWLLAWAGGFRKEKPTLREQQLLEALVPALKRRMSLEWAMNGLPLTRVPLAAAMEEVPRAAFIVNEQGEVHHANAMGRALLEEKLGDISTLLADAVRSRGASGGFTLTPLGGPGMAPHFLVVSQNVATVGDEDRMQRAARKWELTPRQLDVLRLVAHGEANKTISLKLGCSERTVEIHMTALMEKAQVQNRAALVARFCTSV